MQVWSLGQEDPLEEGMAAHSSIPARRIPWTEEPEGLQSTGLQRVGHKWSDLALTQVIWTPLSSVQFSRSVVSNSLQCHESQHARPPCPSPTPRVYPNPCPSSRWCHQAISSSVVPFSSCPHQGLFQWVNSSHQVAKVLEFQLQHQSFQWTPRTDLLYDGLVASPCSPRDSQESSPTPQFKSINSLVLNFLYSLTLTFIHDHRKKHSLD